MAMINTEADFLRALSDHPEWKASVRAQILGEELLQLPVQFQAFVQQQRESNDRMQEFVEQQREFNDRMREFVEQQREFNDQQQRFNQRFESRMDRIEGDISVVKGGHARSRGVDAAPAIADDLGLEYIRTVPRAELVTIARALIDADISAGDRRSFRDADLIIEAASGAGAVYIAVEMSYTADRRDSDRAERNARYLALYTGGPAHAAVASVRNDHELQSLIDAGDIHWHRLAERDLQAA